MRLAAHLALIVLAILLAVVLPQTMFWMACVLAIASLHRGRSLVSAFFLLAAIHCVLGYGMAFKGEESISWLATGQQVWFAKAALAIALGLFSMATAYRFSKHAQPTWLNGLSIDEGRMRNLTRAAVLIAAGVMFYLYAGFSVIDLALQNITEVGKLRYLGSESAVDAYMVIRVSDVLVCTLPLLWLMRQKKADYLIYLLGFVALLLPLRRASIFAVLLLPVLVRFKSINYRKLALLFLVLLAIYGLSQIALMTVYDYDVLSSAASALPEVRDLGWAMELLRSNYLYGATVIQPLDLLPGLIDTWKKTHSISYITAELLDVRSGVAIVRRIKNHHGRRSVSEPLVLWAGALRPCPGLGHGLGGTQHGSRHRSHHALFVRHRICLDLFLDLYGRNTGGSHDQG